MLWECVFRTPTAEGDHAKYITDYAKQGIKVYCNSDVETKKEFPYGSCQIIDHGETYKIGEFSVVPFSIYHDVPSLGYLVHHDDFGNLVFITDTYKMDFSMTGVDHWLIEANYDDRILKANVEDGKIDRAQANRLMLSHMSLDNTVHYLHECKAEKSKNIILCHLSERNSDPDMFKNRVSGEFGVPVTIASKGKVIELNKEII
jgi:phosphoribosyl 1,2-cyclic phosphodiesterase